MFLHAVLAKQNRRLCCSRFSHGGHGTGFSRNGKDVNGRALTVNEARPREARPNRT